MHYLNYSCYSDTANRKDAVTPLLKHNAVIVLNSSSYFTVHFVFSMALSILRKACVVLWAFIFSSPTHTNPKFLLLFNRFKFQWLTHVNRLKNSGSLYFATKSIMWYAAISQQIRIYSWNNLLSYNLFVCLFVCL